MEPCKRPKVLILTPRMPFPPYSGGERWVAALLRNLAGRYRLSLLTFLDSGRETLQTAAALDLERTFLERAIVVPPPRVLAPGGGMPEAAGAFRSREAVISLRRLLGEDPPDLVHVHFLEMAQYIQDIPRGIPALLTEHDSSHFLLRGSYLRRPEWRLMRAYARRFYPRFRVLSTVCEEDARILGRVVPGAPVTVVPLSTRIDGLPPGGRPVRRADSIVFVGQFRHYPNEDAAVHLCRDILPLVRSRIPGARVVLVGADPTPRVRALASECVEITGAVPSVLPYLRRATVFAAPVRLGGGIKCKVLEAFAAGVPVVASRRVAAGFDAVQAAGSMLIGYGAANFAAQTVRLLQDRRLRHRQAAQAREFVRLHHCDKAAAGAFGRLYDGLIGRASHGAI